MGGQETEQELRALPALLSWASVLSQPVRAAPASRAARRRSAFAMEPSAWVGQSPSIVPTRTALVHSVPWQHGRARFRATTLNPRRAAASGRKIAERSRPFARPVPVTEAPHLPTLHWRTLDYPDLAYAHSERLRADLSSPILPPSPGSRSTHWAASDTVAEWAMEGDPGMGGRADGSREARSYRAENRPREQMRM